jgi:hypothetical protein
MNGDTHTPWSERWFRLLLRFYPCDVPARRVLRIDPAPLLRQN